MQCWSDEVTLSLQDYFNDTIQELFEDPDIELQTPSVLPYIPFFLGNITTRILVRIFPS